MREIKFRGYSVEELVGSQWICNGHGIAKVNYIDGTKSFHILTPYGNYQVEEGSIGQYTGLKDMTGKEIFEGDIVEFIHSGEKHTSQIYYKELEGFHFKFTYDNYEYEFSISDLNIPCRKTKIIGNMYENSELLAEHA